MSQSFIQVATLWKTDKRQWIKPSTYAEYVYHLNKHILPFFSKPEAVPITEDTVQQFVHHLRAKGLSLNTIRDSLMVLRMIFKFGVKRGAWPHQEFNVHFPNDVKTNRNAPVMPPSDQKVLLEYIQRNFSFRNLGILICFHTGLRIGEVCALQWQDLDIENGVVHITKTVQRLWLSDGEEKVNSLTIHSPKTATSTRDIPISMSLMKIVRPLRKVMDPAAYVISNSRTPLEPRYYRDYFHRLQKQLGLQPVRFHALRHSFATRCIESKCDYKTVSVILGHASLATTMDLYVHPGFAEKKKVIEKMTRMLRV